MGNLANTVRNIEFKLLQLNRPFAEKSILSDSEEVGHSVLRVSS
jgi:hypothetical protein